MVIEIVDLPFENGDFPLVFHGFPIVLCKRLPGRVGPAFKTVRFTEISKAVSENDGSFKWTNDNFFSPKSLGLFDLFCAGGLREP